jgi:hypothetical protein
MSRLRSRVAAAVHGLDMGIPELRLQMDFVGTVNKALREIGAAQLGGLEDKGSLLRAAISLEGAAPSEMEEYISGLEG